MAKTTRAGRFQRQQGGYRAFMPKALPPADIRLDDSLLMLLSQADRALGRLDAIAELLPGPDLFVAMHVKEEAVLSNQIEGTQASLMDVLEFEAGIVSDNLEQLADVVDVVNYVAAMKAGLDRLATLPLSRRLLCEVHTILMQGTRGGEPGKTPGRFRATQNWIGGASPASASFVPPPPDALADALADFERFLHDPAPMPPLLKMALAHAQFETIHPFLDGNGRIGRLLITFMLADHRILRRPVLYPSLFFQRHKAAYINRLQATRVDGDWEGWLAFFLDGLAQSAVEAADRARGIVALRERDRMLLEMSLGRRTPNALAFHAFLFGQPLVTTPLVEREIGVSQPTAAALVRDLERLGLLKEITGKKRNRIFVYQEYLEKFPMPSST